MNSYPRDYIESCRSRVETQVEQFRKLKLAKERSNEPALDQAFEPVEAAFFNNLVIVLEGYFVHRTRGLELKDGNPLNEVRVLANSMMLNEEKMMADSTVKMAVTKSVLKLEVGDSIRLTEADFVLLYEAFFAELEKKFGA